MVMKRRALVLAVALIATACSGRAPVRVTIAPEAAAVLLGDTLQLTASVSGTADHRVRWSLQGAGQLSQDGLYAAPMELPLSTSVQVTATSLVNPARSATALLTIVSN